AAFGQTACDQAVPSWQLGTMGFIRFGVAPDLPRQIILRRSWADERLRRFEAQVCDAQGHALLTIHHMEFGRQEAAPLPSATELP
ncbi:MAG: hypothetical protein Q4F27_06010, partial [Desulfovibrionaceae bacterium]|nr:hypothetical protein [Desulfovibrionaceae bacterium]